MANKRKIHEREELLEELLKEFRSERRVEPKKNAKKKQERARRKLAGLGSPLNRIERRALDEKTLDRIAKRALQKPFSGGRCG